MGWTSDYERTGGVDVMPSSLGLSMLLLLNAECFISFRHFLLLLFGFVSFRHLGGSSRATVLRFVLRQTSLEICILLLQSPNHRVLAGQRAFQRRQVFFPPRTKRPRADPITNPLPLPRAE